MAKLHNFPPIVKGETLTITISGMTKDGVPVDLTGYTLVLVFKDQDGEVLEEYSQVVESMPFTFKVPATETDTWPVGNNKYSFKYIQPNGDVKFPFYGSLTVKELN